MKIAMKWIWTAHWNLHQCRAQSVSPHFMSLPFPPFSSVCCHQATGSWSASTPTILSLSMPSSRRPWILTSPATSVSCRASCSQLGPRFFVWTRPSWPNGISARHSAPSPAPSLSCPARSARTSSAKAAPSPRCTTSGPTHSSSPTGCTATRPHSMEVSCVSWLLPLRSASLDWTVV